MKNKELAGFKNSLSNLEEFSRLARTLTPEEIMEFTDEEILSLVIERPGHPGQFGFLFSPKEFDSQEHLSAIAASFMKRLAQVKK